MNFSPGGLVWSGCRLHPPVSCVAVCALVDHADVRCSQPGRSAPRGGTAVAGEVPEKYYVVGNNDHILLKYILVYETRSVHPTHTNVQGELHLIGLSLCRMYSDKHL